MRVVAIIPFRSLRSGKQRLSGVLEDEDRERLNRNLLNHVIAETRTAAGISQTLVVSPDDAALKLARVAGVDTLREHGDGGLNAALEQAIETVDAAAVLIVAADLPLLRSATITELLALREDAPQVIIAPDRHGKGTNLLYLAPPRVIAPQFGVDSHTLHVRGARAARAQVSHFYSAATAVDIDSPEDWQNYAERLGELAEASRS